MSLPRARTLATAICVIYVIELGLKELAITEGISGRVGLLDHAF